MQLIALTLYSIHSHTQIKFTTPIAIKADNAVSKAVIGQGSNDEVSTTECECDDLIISIYKTLVVQFKLQPSWKLYNL